MALWADLHRVGIDLWSVLDGEGPHSAAEALAAAEALPDDSRTAAALMGDLAAFGWGSDRELAVATYNVLIELLRYTPMWKQTPEIAHIESPAAKARKKTELHQKKSQVQSNRGVMSMFGL